MGIQVAARQMGETRKSVTDGENAHTHTDAGILCRLLLDSVQTIVACADARSELCFSLSENCTVRQYDEPRGTGCDERTMTSW